MRCFSNYALYDDGEHIHAKIFNKTLDSIFFDDAITVNPVSKWQSSAAQKTLLVSATVWGSPSISKDPFLFSDSFEMLEMKEEERLR